MRHSIDWQIYKVVERIPRGRVATYGQIAALAGIAGRARQVGYALNRLPEDSNVPWHRVINAQGEISRRSNPEFEEFQRFLLEREGIVLDEKGRVSLERYQWRTENK